jgi:hypothetical protein
MITPKAECSFSAGTRDSVHHRKSSVSGSALLTSSTTLKPPSLIQLLNLKCEHAQGSENSALYA